MNITVTRQYRNRDYFQRKDTPLYSYGGSSLVGGASPGGGSGGDVYLASNQTFTGANTFTAQTLYSGACVHDANVSHFSEAGFAWIRDKDGITLESRLGGTGGGDVYLANNNVFTGTNAFQDVGIASGQFLQGLSSSGFGWIVDGSLVTLENRLTDLVSKTGTNIYSGVNTYTANTLYNSACVHDANISHFSSTGFAWIKDSAGTTLESRLGIAGGGYVYLHTTNVFTGVNAFTIQTLFYGATLHYGNISSYDEIGFAWIKDSAGTTLESRLTDDILSSNNTWTGTNTYQDDIYMYLGTFIWGNGTGFEWIKDSSGNTLESRLGVTGGDVYLANNQTFSGVNTFSADLYAESDLYLEDNLYIWNNLTNTTETGFAWIKDGIGTTLESRLLAGGGDVYLANTQTFTGGNTFTGWVSFESRFNTTTGSLYASAGTGFYWIRDGAGTTLESRLAVGGNILFTNNTWSGTNSYGDDIFIISESIIGHGTGFAWIRDGAGTTLESRLGGASGGGDVYLANNQSFTGFNTFNVDVYIRDNLINTTETGFAWIEDDLGTTLESRLTSTILSDNNVFTGTNAFEAGVNLEGVSTLLAGNFDFGTNAVIGTALDTFIVLWRTAELAIAGSTIQQYLTPLGTFDWIIDNNGITVEDRLQESCLLDYDNIITANNTFDNLILADSATPVAVEGKVQYIKNHATLDDGLYIYDGTTWQAAASW